MDELWQYRRVTCRPSHHGPRYGPQCHSQTGLLAWIRLEETQYNQEKMEILLLEEEGQSHSLPDQTDTFLLPL